MRRDNQDFCFVGGPRPFLSRKFYIPSISQQSQVVSTSCHPIWSISEYNQWIELHIYDLPGFHNGPDNLACHKFVWCKPVVPYSKF